MSKNVFNNREGYDTPEYKSWRFAIFARDTFKCVLCPNKDDIEAHHIVRWADRPSLRYAVSNGCTLCKTCHEMVTGREQEFEAQFKKIVALKKIEQKGYIKAKFTAKKKWKPYNPRQRY